MMSKKEELLNDKVYYVGGKIVQAMDAPNGVVLPQEIENFKGEFFKFLTAHLADTVVDVKKSYPNNESMDITFSSEFVVMRKEDFSELIKL